ncbi:MAG: DUF2281 domain-containing protein [Chromatiales bacterium]|nr:DUF2281 domain-containing protein [Chromatiales bacterium]
MNLPETIYAHAQTLPVELRREALDFIDYLQQRYRGHTPAVFEIPNPSLPKLPAPWVTISLMISTTQIWEMTPLGSLCRDRLFAGYQRLDRSAEKSGWCGGRCASGRTLSSFICVLPCGPSCGLEPAKASGSLRIRLGFGIWSGM